MQDNRVITLDVPGQLTLDDPSLTLEAVLAGMGLAYLAEWRVSESVREGKLRPGRLHPAASGAMPLLSKPPIPTRRIARSDLIH